MASSDGRYAVLRLDVGVKTSGVRIDDANVARQKSAASWRSRITLDSRKMVIVGESTSLGFDESTSLDTRVAMPQVSNDGDVLLRIEDLNHETSDQSLITAEIHSLSKLCTLSNLCTDSNCSNCKLQCLECGFAVECGCGCAIARRRLTPSVQPSRNLLA
jgi:hypothetical protein